MGQNNLTAPLQIMSLYKFNHWHGKALEIPVVVEFDIKMAIL